MTNVRNIRTLSRTVLTDPAYVYVGRRCAGIPGSVWGNPFKVGKDGVIVAEKRVNAAWWERCRNAAYWREDMTPVERAVAYYWAWVCDQEDLLNRLDEIRDKTLLCWCCDWNPGEPIVKPCHAIVLAGIADGS